MKLYQCSKCKCLYDGGDNHVYCRASVDGGDPRFRTEEGAELCRQNFEPLNNKEVWHEPFYWENWGKL